MSTPQSNKALILRFYEEVWNKGNVKFVHEVFAEDYVRHDLRPSQAPPGPSGQETIAIAFRKAFPDIHYTIDLAIAEDDLVCLRWTATGTMIGDWGGVPATGKKLNYSGVNIFRFKNGKVSEIWNHRDDLGVAQQMGAPVYAGAPVTDRQQRSK